MRSSFKEGAFFYAGIDIIVNGNQKTNFIWWLVDDTTTAKRALEGKQGNQLRGKKCALGETG